MHYFTTDLIHVVLPLQRKPAVVAVLVGVRPLGPARRASTPVFSAGNPATSWSRYRRATRAWRGGCRFLHQNPQAPVDRSDLVGALRRALVLRVAPSPLGAVVLLRSSGSPAHGRPEAPRPRVIGVHLGRLVSSSPFLSASGLSLIHI